MRSLASICALLLLGSCAGTVKDWALGRHPVCDVHRLQREIGRRATPGLARHIEWTSRAQSIRYVRPESTLQELRPDRVTVTIDAGNRITAIRCG